MPATIAVPSHQEKNFDLLLETMVENGLEKLDCHLTEMQYQRFIEETAHRERKIMEETAEILQEINALKEDWRDKSQVEEKQRLHFNQRCNQVEKLLRLRKITALVTAQSKLPLISRDADPRPERCKGYRELLDQIREVYGYYYDVVRQARETYRTFHPKFPGYPSEAPCVEYDPERDYYKWHLGPRLDLSSEASHRYRCCHEGAGPTFDFQALCLNTLIM